MSRWLMNVWYSGSRLGGRDDSRFDSGSRLGMFLLYPVALIYRLIIFLRRCLYRLGIFKTTQFPVPVIVVGNITVGGTGKTPLVIELCRQLKEAGFHPGVVSRGYGANTSSFPCHVVPTSDPVECGDEPVLIVRRADVPVVIAPDRVAAADALLSEYEVDVIVSDDGLQHYALGRDFEICVVDGQRGLGNRSVLPAGPLREAVSRLLEVDLIVVNGEHEAVKATLPAAKPVVDMQLQTLTPKRVCGKSDSWSPEGVWHAVAGIGNPARFFATLKGMGLELVEYIFNDHHKYSLQDIDIEGNIIMTEKDAVKCRAFADERHWYVPVRAECAGLVKALPLSLALSQRERGK